MKGTERLREIAQQGGKSVQPQHRAFSKDRTLASEAGRKGAAAREANRKKALAKQQEK